MKIKANVIGEIIDSSKMIVEDQASMLKLFKSLPDQLSPISDVDIDILGYDRFKISVANPEKSLRVALAIRALIYSNKFVDGPKRWNARLGIDIETSDSNHDYIKDALLVVNTPWEDVNRELKVLTPFADNIATGWTQSQSRIMSYRLISGENQIEISDKLGISHQMVSKSLKAANEHLICAFIENFETLIKNKNCLNYKYWKEYTKQSSRFYIDKMLELTANGNEEEIKGRLRGEETPNHLMFKLPILRCPENPEIYYEFLIEYDRNEPDVGIYYGVKCISPLESDHDKAIEIANNHWLKINDNLCVVLNNVFVDKDFTHRFKMTNNANDNTYWPFWITLVEDEDINKVGLLAIKIIRDVYEMTLYPTSKKTYEISKFKNSQLQPECISRFTDDGLKYLWDTLDGIKSGRKSKKVEIADRKVSTFIDKFLQAALEEKWFKRSEIPGANRGYVFINSEQGEEKQVFTIVWMTLLKTIGEKLSRKIDPSWKAVSHVFLGKDGSVWTEDNLKSTYSKKYKTDSEDDSEDKQFWREKINKIFKEHNIE